MLERNGFMPVNYLKKESFTGSYLGMRFKMTKAQVGEGEEENRPSGVSLAGALWV